MSHSSSVLAVRAVLLAFVCWSAVIGTTKADVFNMPNGLTSLETVTVGNPGNAPDTRVMTDGTTGFGAVPNTYQYRSSGKDA